MSSGLQHKTEPRRPQTAPSLARSYTNDLPWGACVGVRQFLMSLLMIHARANLKQKLKSAGVDFEAGRERALGTEVLSSSNKPPPSSQTFGILLPHHPHSQLLIKALQNMRLDCVNCWCRKSSRSLESALDILLALRKQHGLARSSP